MTDRYDSLYDTVNARRFGSLRNDDSVTETMCDAFFKTRSSLEDITKSVQGALNAVGDQPVQDLHRNETNEYQLKPSVVTKPVDYLENLIPGTMYGKQEAVVRRSQIKSESVQQAVSASQGKSVQPLEPPRLVQLRTPERNVIPMPGSRLRPAALQNNTPSRVLDLLTSLENNISGSVARSRCVEPLMTSNAEQGACAEQNRADHSTVSKNKSRCMCIGSARFRCIQQTGVRGDLLLKNAVVPNEHGLHKGLNNRNVGLEIVRRGLSSIPKEVVKERQSSDFAGNSALRDHQNIPGPINSTTKRRACSACHVSGTDPVASSSYHSKTRSSSATRALDHLLKTARSPTGRQNNKRRTNDKRMVLLMAQQPSANRLIPLSDMTMPAHNQESTAGPLEPEDGNRLLVPVKLLSAQQSSAARGVAVQPSAQRRVKHGQPHPRSSVIRFTPVKRGRGDGTPLRGFRTELRRYPIPTGSTPTLRPLTAFKEFRFHQNVPQNVGDWKQKRMASTVHGLSSSRRLSKKQLRALIDRLAVPKRVPTTVFRTPMRIRNEQAHGESCVKGWGCCRPMSPSRRPASAKDHIVDVSATRALLSSCDESSRCPSIEPRTQPELH